MSDDRGETIPQSPAAGAAAQPLEFRVLESSLDAIADFAYVFDRHGRFVYVNRALLELWGLRPDQAVGRNFYELNYPNDLADRLQAQINAVIETRQRVVDETEYTSPSGRGGFYEYIFSPVFAADGSVEAVAGLTRDITRRKELAVERERLLADIQNGRARLAAVIENAPAFICTLRGPNHIFDIANGQYFKLVNNRNVIGKPVREALPEVEGQGFFELLDRVYQTGESFVGAEVPLDLRATPTSAPDRRFLNFVYQAMRESDGSISGIFVHGVDVTDQKRLLDEREHLLEAERSARSEVERIGRMKDEFLATLSHELRTPLNAILGWTQILGGAGRTDEDLAEGLATIERNARAQTQIIEDLLDMSRIISGKVRLDVQRIDLAPVVKAAMETTRHAAEAKGVRLQSVLDPLAGPIAGDPNRLQQVFWNLLTNAIKFTPRGGRIQVLLERVNSHLQVSVSDTGEGISPEFLPHVFDRFRQADASTTRKHGGLGLGLSIVKQLVELHGGAIRVKSGGTGLGSTFIVDLPLAAVHAARDSDAAERHPRAPSSGSTGMYDPCVQLAGVRILVVDDEPDARAMLRRVLVDCDAVVTTAGSAAEALKCVIDEKFDAVVSDIGMPGEDGYSLIRQIRALPADQGGQTPAVALTAYARAEDRVKAVMAGFQHHIAKPVEPAELIAMVASLTGRLNIRP
jgi:PAS domain S-box-containing protein